MRDIIVVGGSAGALEPVCTLLKSLPPKLAASLFIVIHVPETNSRLCEVLQRCGSLVVANAKNGLPIQHGCVYVAPGGSHLVLDDGQMQLSKGPRENRHRPSVDTLFRSAARAHRERVIAIVVSGALDDGTAGAMAVKNRGGVVIVQKPEEARVPAMPSNVLRYVGADYCLPAAEMAATLSRLVKERAKTKRRTAPASSRPARNGNGEAKAAPMVCPDCGGPLTETRKKNLLHFECRVGHQFSPEAVTEAHANALERALWVALRHLSERRAIHQTLAAGQYRDDPVMVRRYQENAEAASHDIALLREILERL